MLRVDELVRAEAHFSGGRDIFLDIIKKHGFAGGDSPGDLQGFVIDRMFGFAQLAAFTPDRWLEDGDRVRVGNVELQVLHCPGHTPGHVVFFSPPDRLAFVGDVLFDGSIGRTDFPRGDHAALIRSITGKLWPLGEEVTFIPGHGPLSTFGDQRRYNPFVGDEVLARGG